MDEPILNLSKLDKCIMCLFVAMHIRSGPTNFILAPKEYNQLIREKMNVYDAVPKDRLFLKNYVT